MTVATSQVQPLSPIAQRFLRNPLGVTWRLWKAAFTVPAILSLSLFGVAVEMFIISLVAHQETWPWFGSQILLSNLARGLSYFCVMFPFAFVSLTFLITFLGLSRIAVLPAMDRDMDLAWQELNIPDETTASANRDSSAEHCVYFVTGRDGATKIGMTGNLTQRLRELRTANGIAELLFSIPCSSMQAARALESHYHLRFLEQRVAGEWFTLSAQDLAAVKSEHLNGTTDK